MWIAKNSLNDKTYGNKFKDIMDCQHYIDTELKLLNWLYWNILHEEDCIEGNPLRLRLGNVIRCYNVSQERFCDGFDF